jgi:hypothetical protein
VGPNGRGQGIAALVALALVGPAAGCGGPAALGFLQSPEREPCPLVDPGPAGTRPPEPDSLDPVVPHRKRAWEAARGGTEAARPFIRARLAGWPRRFLIERGDLPLEDGAFLRRLASDTWRGLLALRDRENGLPVDHVHFGPELSLADSAIGDYTSTTNIGLHLLAVAGAVELRLIDRAEALALLERVLETLGRLEDRAGFYFNFYDTTSEERTTNFLSFVDSSWLTAGLIVVRAAFPELRDAATGLIERGDYRFFFDPEAGLMAHGYYVHRARRSRFHYGMLYAEARLGSLIAIGKREAPPGLWFRMVRTFPESCAWQNRPPRARHAKRMDGVEFRGGWYEWQGLRYVPSWGGSMFEALMPTLLIDEPRHAARSLGANDAAHAAVQRRYALEDLALPVWGMSPSAIPATGLYGEHGVPLLGAAGYAAGVVSPHASALALGIDPVPAIANLRRLAERYDLYGEYGLYDAVDPASGRIAHSYLALDQSMVFLALVNHLTDGSLRALFASDPIVQRALPLIGAEDFFD